MYIAICKDKPNSHNLRLELRGSHVDFIEKNNTIIKLAGPILSDDSQQMIGSMLLINLPKKEDVMLFLKEDPYSKGSLFESVDIIPYKLVVNNLQ